MKHVIHLIPFDGIGGVEAAAQTMPDGPITTEVFFRKQFIFENPTDNINQPMGYLKILSGLRNEPPILLISSLWRSYLISIALQILRPENRYVTFLHAAKCAHLVDKFLAWASMKISTEIWADSQQTIESRVPYRLRGKARVISYLLDRPAPPIIRPKCPRFVFWGRLAPQKGLERAIKLFALIYKSRLDATFDIIGPDRGELEKLKKSVIDAGIDGAVRFHGGLKREACFEIADACSFYLQTSNYEGMAVSVVEAMQRGLVPIVTPVGEIQHYCHDGVNAIIVDDLEVAAQRVLDLLSNANAHEAMWRAAVAEWQDRPLYREDMAASINALLNKRNGNRKPAIKMHDESR